MYRQGPFSRIKRVQVKCDKCGKYKNNVIYKATNEIKEKSANEKKEEKNEEKKVIIAPKKLETHYIKDIINHQKELASKYSLD